MKETLYVTQPVLPPIDDFIASLKEIWANKVLTNGGPFHQHFENALAEYLGVKHLSLFANGTLALVTALQAHRIAGEVITTPFSFVATAHSIWWNGIKPVFADIDPITLNLNPRMVEAAITPQTTAIMPVHVYGHPCDVEAFREIGEVYGVKIIYDAAHAFGVRHRDQSLMSFGDLSVMSFHATKVFNTIEGGAIICPDERIKRRIDFLKNFGYCGETKVIAPGINAKMNELQSAYGLLQLKSVDNHITAREQIFRRYKNLLAEVPGIHVHDWPTGTKANFAYCPILVDSEKYGRSRNDLYHDLKKVGIHARMYFYPLITSFNTYSGLPSAAPSNLPIANAVAESILCLPIYPDLALDQVDRVCEEIQHFHAISKAA